MNFSYEEIARFDPPGSGEFIEQVSEGRYRVIDLVAEIKKYGSEIYFDHSQEKLKWFVS